MKYHLFHYKNCFFPNFELNDFPYLPFTVMTICIGLKGILILCINFTNVVDRSTKKSDSVLENKSFHCNKSYSLNSFVVNENKVWKESIYYWYWNINLKYKLFVNFELLISLIWKKVRMHLQSSQSCFLVLMTNLKFKSWTDSRIDASSFAFGWDLQFCFNISFFATMYSFLSCPHWNR